MFGVGLDSFFPRSPAAAVATSSSTASVRGSGERGHAGLEIPFQFPPSGRFAPRTLRCVCFVCALVSSDGCSSSSGQLWSASWRGASVQARRCGTTTEPAGKQAFC